MNKNAICTITTISHLYKVFALAESVQEFGYELNVLVVDADDLEQVPASTSINFFTLSDISSSKSKEMAIKYKNNKNKLRWGLKPIFLEFLLENYNRVIYSDNDVYFFQSPSMFFKELEVHSVVLTPHFYSSQTEKNQNWLEANFTVGLFNAGFIAVNRNGINALQWWAKCCLYNIKKSYSRGLFDDQKYLDLFPILFEKVKILKQPGSNLAGWNDEVLQPTGAEVNFIHFADLTMSKFRNPQSNYHSFYRKYIEVLNKYNSDFKFKLVYYSKYSILNYIRFVLWNISRLVEK
ncbi:MAG: hypothetical protein ACJAV5_000175 [Vicingaceae bacterium]|jgi:hypothetical protein